MNCILAYPLVLQPADMVPTINPQRRMAEEGGASGKQDQKLSNFCFLFGGDARLQTCRCALFDYNGRRTYSTELKRLLIVATHCSCKFSMAVLYGGT